MSEPDPFNPKVYTNVLPGHVTRMSNECRDLVKNLSKLEAFIEDKTMFPSLEAYEQRRLVEQREHMERYAMTLSLRYFKALLDYGRD